MINHLHSDISKRKDKISEQKQMIKTIDNYLNIKNEEIENATKEIAQLNSKSDENKSDQSSLKNDKNLQKQFFQKYCLH